MIFLFAIVILLLFVFHRTFRKVILIGAAVIVFASAVIAVTCINASRTADGPWNNYAAPTAQCPPWHTDPSGVCVGGP